MRTRPAIDAMTPIEAIDPQWAWERWEPTNEHPWNAERVQFLFRRGGFNANRDERREALQAGPSGAIQMLHGEWPRSERARQEAFENDSAAIASAVRVGGDNDALAAWWLHRMIHSPSPLVEKMTLFWHGHFATGAEKVMDSELMYEQNRVLRKYALGDFRPMVHEISKDPAMLIYLDSVANRKAHPNENYARELMELFCLGEGNYTEQDVQELARCFTGWEIRRKMFRFNPYQHDSGMKSILGKTEIESGEQAIDWVLAQPAMPRFIASKLFRYLVCDEPRAPAALIEPLATHFVASEYSIRSLVDKILESRLMMSLWSCGRKIRSPVELAVECIRTLSATTNLDRLTKMLRPLGQALFYPPNVKGWDGGRAWINSSTLIGRSNFIVDFLNEGNTRFGGKTLDAWCTEQGINTNEEWGDWLVKALMAIPISPSEQKRLSETSLPGASAATRTSLLIALTRNPKIHLS